MNQWIDVLKKNSINDLKKLSSLHLTYVSNCFDLTQVLCVHFF